MSGLMPRICHQSEEPREWKPGHQRQQDQVEQRTVTPDRRRNAIDSVSEHRDDRTTTRPRPAT
jgi:hypothetical protein